MIGQLRGKLTERRPNQVMVDVAGVGYLVQIPLSTFSVLGGLNSDVTLLIHTHVREDQFTLYGFLTAREKQIFELLLTVSGVGPSLALKILSGMRISELLPAIRNSDLALLERIPGIGKKPPNESSSSCATKPPCSNRRKRENPQRARRSNRMWLPRC